MKYYAIADLHGRYDQRAAVRDVAPNDVPVTAARIMSTEFPRLRKINDAASNS